MINPRRGVRREGVGDRGAGALTPQPVGTRAASLERRKERKGKMEERTHVPGLSLGEEYLPAKRAPGAEGD